MRLLLFIFFFFTYSAQAQLTTDRKKQLDSIVTNIDRKILNNLDSVHTYLHKNGKEDAERVFMFYGYISIHHKYDMSRIGAVGGSDRKEYTAYYTARKKSGVCRDFAALFKDLCDRSDIPCIVANGKVKIPWWLAIYRVVTLRYNARHAWNIVKYRGKWHLMDPTWSQVYKTEKYYRNEDGAKRYSGKVKRPTRFYYDASPRAFYFGRNAAHPAFYLSSTVYTYKTSRRKYKRREVLYEDYDFNKVLDSLASDSLYTYSGKFVQETSSYSEESSFQYDMYYLFDFLELKRTKLDPLTKEACEKHLAELAIILKYVRESGNGNYAKEYHEHLFEIDNFMNKKGWI